VARVRVMGGESGSPERALVAEGLRAGEPRGRVGVGPLEGVEGAESPLERRRFAPTTSAARAAEIIATRN
jgi:hypothetical protein